MTKPNRQLTIAVGLIERENRILITRRFDPEYPQWHHRWEFPGGKIGPGETPLEALKREIMEETRLTVHSPRLLGVHTHHWNNPDHTQQTFILLYHCHANPGDVSLCPEENDAFSWEYLENILQRQDLLEGNIKMLKELYLQQAK